MEKKGASLIKDIRNMSQGEQLWGKYLVLEKNIRKIKDGRDITNLKVGDATGDIDVIVWDTCNISGIIQVGTVIGLLGDLGLYNNRLQVTAKRVKVLEEDPASYLKTPDMSVDELIQEFDQMVASINDYYLHAVIERIFDSSMREKFFHAPAAKKIHHNYVGGLLEHTLHVANLCIKAADIYPMLNRDLLITGAIMHDIGKVQEYEIKITPEYTVAGRMLGHIVQGNEVLGEAIKAIRQEKGDFPEYLEIMLKHMVLSHHGNLEYGSPVKPLFPEAMLLHMMDNLDAKMFVFFNKINEEEEGEGLFTNYDSFFEQTFFKYRYKSDF